MSKHLSKAKAEQAFRAIQKQFAAHIGAECEPKLYEPGFHASGWTIGWEEGPSEWTYRAFQGGTDEELFYLVKDQLGADRAAKLAKDPGVTCPAGVFAEPVNHWCLGLYPA